MRVVKAKVYNPLTRLNEYEYSSSIDNLPVDRWLQLGLEVTLEVIDQDEEIRALVNTRAVVQAEIEDLKGLIATAKDMVR